jgi:hypothetical protein
MMGGVVTYGIGHIDPILRVGVFKLPIDKKLHLWLHSPEQHS